MNQSDRIDMTKSTELQLLEQLAARWGVQTTYVDMAGTRVRAAPETLRAALAALGVTAGETRDVRAALKEQIDREWNRIVEPVIVAWDGAARSAPLRLPARASHSIAFRLHLEDGRTHRWVSPIRELPMAEDVPIELAGYEVRLMTLPQLPWGYHSLEVETNERSARSLVVAAPTRSYSEPDAPRRWGIFAPIYSLHSGRSWGAGSLGEWNELVKLAAAQGGRVAGTLPLLASFLQGPGDSSPYAPASRLLWNEFYIDVARVPEFAASEAAQKRVRSPDFRRQITAQKQNLLVNYSREMALKRAVLEEMAEYFFSHDSKRRRDFHRFVRRHPDADRYARFRAVGERLGRNWQEWPERLRHGDLRRSDFAEPARRYHLYAQWLMHQQMDEMTSAMREREVCLYLDLPLGTSADSYDVWRERSIFVLGASGGAPPDPCFTRGQDWGFPPMHPHRIREQGYRYWLEHLRFQMRHADMLRIDHVMGLHRLYWIPHGLPATHGAYVTYPAEELYALLTLESHRHKTVVVGENLGTVPPEVNERLDRHGIRRMYVAQYEARPSQNDALPEPDRHVVASLNTHDMPPFAAYWKGLDVQDRYELGLLTRTMAHRERRRRRSSNRTLVKFLVQRGWLKAEQKEAGPVFQACLKFLAASSAETVLINLEDLWGEEESQNVPGTTAERSNWRRKTRLALEEIARSPEIATLLKQIDRLRSREPARERILSRERAPSFSH
jgi:4-alpha-glucanotransferase